MNLTTTVDGFDVTYRRLDGPAPTLVLLHGAGGNHLAWDEVLPKIGGLDVVVPSLPGRCGSEGAALGTVAAVADWLRKLLWKLGLSRVVVAGHSFGGAVALEYALAEGRAGNRGGPALAGLVMICSGARLRVAPALLAGLEEAADAGLHSDLPAKLSGRRSDPDIMLRQEAAATKTPPSVALVDWRAVNGFDRMEDLAGVGCPTLVISGDADELTPPKYASYLAAHISGARHEVHEGAGHMLPFERHETLAAQLHDFVADLAEAPVGLADVALQPA